MQGLEKCVVNHPCGFMGQRVCTIDVLPESAGGGETKLGFRHDTVTPTPDRTGAPAR